MSISSPEPQILQGLSNGLIVWFFHFTISKGLRTLLNEFVLNSLNELFANELGNDNVLVLPFLRDILISLPYFFRILACLFLRHCLLTTFSRPWPLLLGKFLDWVSCSPAHSMELASFVPA